MQSECEPNLTIPNPKRLVQVSLTQDLNCHPSTITGMQGSA